MPLLLHFSCDIAITLLSYVTWFGYYHAASLWPIRHIPFHHALSPRVIITTIHHYLRRMRHFRHSCRHCFHFVSLMPFMFCFGLSLALVGSPSAISYTIIVYVIITCWKPLVMLPVIGYFHYASLTKVVGFHWVTRASGWLAFILFTYSPGYHRLALSSPVQYGFSSSRQLLYATIIAQKVLINSET